MLAQLKTVESKWEFSWKLYGDPKPLNDSVSHIVLLYFKYYKIPACYHNTPYTFVVSSWMLLVVKSSTSLSETWRN